MRQSATMNFYTIQDMVPSPDPAYFERMFTCEGAANWSNYCKEETDKCMVEARLELDPARRADLYKKCQKIMYEDAQLGGLFQAENIIVIRKELKGLMLQYTTEEMRESWIDK
jgi:peptide/nickel transport system substrate-binding protein